jgi:xanthine dehydrogenase YagT iron-sulfur-binding subunit
MKNDEAKRSKHRQSGMTRRGFITSLGAGAVGVAASGALLSEGAKASDGEEVKAAKALSKLRLEVNGRPCHLLVEPRWSLLFVLREKLGFTGTKIGCERGECGACTILMDGVPRYACQTLAPEAEGHEITTIEGLMEGEGLGPVQQAFLEEDAYQCGYCTPGQVMAAEGLLRANLEPSDEEILAGMSGNYCRCAAYKNIFQAVKNASNRRLEQRSGGRR